ncbi:hypothetical protein [Enterococcus mediterraneensis]|uniref:hypothetical protein n=1 Tax=Enterococcus mediterraneensis TaxID=2364791 RepID=UPI000F05567F|nr:hypothetical protein [Enterococcus mediterraneensis]
MEKDNRLIYKVCGISSIAVAIFAVLFIVLLAFTFDFAEWKGIVNYQNAFHPIQMLTVVPSMLLAISYVVFVSGLHIYASGNKKIWNQLALSFGLLYAGISIANYLIQLVTVIPSVQNGMTEGLTLLVSGYSNSIFYALMASYFLMCISLFFAAFVFSKEDKNYKWIRRLFVCSALAIPLFLVGVAFDIAIIMMLGAMAWLIGATVGMFALGACFHRETHSLGINKGEMHG